MERTADWDSRIFMGVGYGAGGEGEKNNVGESSDAEGFKVSNIPYMAPPLLWANFNDWLA